MPAKTIVLAVLLLVPARLVAAGGPARHIDRDAIGQPSRHSPPDEGIRRAAYVVPAQSPPPSSTRPTANGPSGPAGNAPSPLALVPLGARAPARTRLPARGDSPDAPRPPRLLPSLLAGFGSLAVVLGIFLVCAWGLRRIAPASAGLLPREVLEVLGRAPLAGRQQAHLVRCGSKLLLVHFSPSGAETLTEITDPCEVDRLAGLCRQARWQGTAASFRSIFRQVLREKQGRDLAGTTAGESPGDGRGEDAHA